MVDNKVIGKALSPKEDCESSCWRVVKSTRVYICRYIIYIKDISSSGASLASRVKGSLPIQREKDEKEDAFGFYRSNPSLRGSLQAHDERVCTVLKRSTLSSLLWTRSLFWYAQGWFPDIALYVRALRTKREKDRERERNSGGMQTHYYDYYPRGSIARTILAFFQLTLQHPLPLLFSSSLSVSSLSTSPLSTFFVFHLSFSFSSPLPFSLSLLRSPRASQFDFNDFASFLDGNIIRM